MQSYTATEMRVVEVVRAEIRARGRSTLTLAEMASRASASRSTASLAIRKARKAGDLVVRHRQEIGDSNVIMLPRS